MMAVNNQNVAGIFNKTSNTERIRKRVRHTHRRMHALFCLGNMRSWAIFFCLLRVCSEFRRISILYSPGLTVATIREKILGEFLLKYATDPNKLRFNVFLSTLQLFL